MAFIEFTRKNVINVPEIDDQHRGLFDILNRLHAATVQGREQSELVEILDKLVEYTVIHFETEEDHMTRLNYPDYENHKKEHDDLTGQAVELQRQFREGSATISFELLDFLHNWLNDHTMGTDQDMGRFLQDRM